VGIGHGRLRAHRGETPIDISELTAKAKARGVRTRAELNDLEAEGVFETTAKYLSGSAKLSERLAPFTFAWCLKLHGEMFRDVWMWAGRIRKRNLNLGCNHAMIVDELQRLLDDLAAWPGYGMSALEQSVRLHHRAVQIHPFENGNGRWARLLGNIWLRRHDEPIVVWPDKLVDNVSPVRAEYIAAVKLADDGDYGPLLEMHARYWQRKG
jgi:Fic-DOC domain mobile mystery protein B